MSDNRNLRKKLCVIKALDRQPLRKPIISFAKLTKSRTTTTRKKAVLCLTRSKPIRMKQKPVIYLTRPRLQRNPSIALHRSASRRRLANVSLTRTWHRPIPQLLVSRGPRTNHRSRRINLVIRPDRDVYNISRYNGYTLATALLHMLRRSRVHNISRHEVLLRDWISDVLIDYDPLHDPTR